MTDHIPKFLSLGFVHINIILLICLYGHQTVLSQTMHVFETMYLPILHLVTCERQLKMAMGNGQV